MFHLKPQVPILLPLLTAMAITPLHSADPFQLPAGQTCVAYQFKIQTDGGLPPLHWAINGGSLPPGLELEEGIISGTPSQAQAAPFQFSIEVSDSSQPPQKYSQSLSLLVKARALKMLLSANPLRMVIDASSAVSDPPANPPSRVTSPETAIPEPSQGGSPPQAVAATSIPPHPAASNLGGSQAGGDGKEDKEKKSAGTPQVEVQPPQGFDYMAPLGEALVGVDVSAASSVDPKAVMLASGIFDVPLKHGFQFYCPKDDQNKDNQNYACNNQPWWLSGKLGLQGMAQPGALSGAASAGYFASAANSTPDKIVQSVDFSLHVGKQLHKWQVPIETFDVKAANGSDGKQSTLATLSIIAGVGAVTPLSASQSSPTVYEATPLILQHETPVSPFTSFASSCSANPTTTPTCFVIFVPNDRTHFYRSYDGGFRLKLYGNDNADNVLRFPAILDLTIGQNEYVTGGSWHGAVLHLGGSFPVPRVDSFYVFGSFDLGLSNANGGGPQLQFIPAPATLGLSPSSPGVYTILTSQPNRDRYTLGFGIDVFHLMSSYLKSKSAPPPSQPAAQH